MRRAAFVLAGFLFASGCAGPLPFFPPAIDCGSLDDSECGAAVAAATREVDHVGTIVAIAVDHGTICPQGPFTTTTCPGGALPPVSGGEWMGHAVVTFDHEAAQAYVNISKDGMTVRAHAVALATPQP